MNTKHILLLLPFLMIYSINAITYGEKLEKTRTELLNCKQSLHSRIIGCEEYEQEYSKIRTEISDQLHVAERELISQSRPTTIFGCKLPFDYKKYRLQAYLLSGFLEYFCRDRVLPKFEEKENTNFEKYYTTIIENEVIYLPSSYATDVLGSDSNIINTDPQELNTAKQSVLSTINKIAQKQYN